MAQRRKRKAAPPSINTYHLEQSVKAIKFAIDTMKGKDVEDIIFNIRRNYPFGDRKASSHAYKVWNKQAGIASALLREGKEYSP